MSGIKEALRDALKKAMKSRDQLALDAIRMASSAIQYKEIEKGKELSEGDFVQVLSTLCKQHRESAEEYRKGGRAELAEKEENELKVLTPFLPVQLSTNQLEKEVKIAVKALGAKDVKDLGRVIKSLREKLVGQVDGKLLSDVVKKILSAQSGD